MAINGSSSEVVYVSGNVAYVRPEILDLLPVYNMIRDVLAGEKAVKTKKEVYLPIPNAGDLSTENKARYTSYLTRANFVNYTKRTMGGLIGQVFLREPVVEIPPLLDPIKSDASGSGITLNQLAGMIVAKGLAFGRVGVFVDYPDTDVPATVAAIASGKIRPSIILFNPWDVINWRTIIVNGREIFSLVVIQENIPTEDDGFEVKFDKQWRVLSLKNGIYQVDLYKQSNEGFSINETYYPKDSTGKNLTEVPFMFVGSNNNDATPDDPPIYDLASVNLAHYRNSADYEEMCFLVGQPTPFFTNLTEHWVKNVLEGKIELGSRSSIPLPQGSTAGILQIKSDGIIKEAMEMKERQMTALGAKLVQQQQVQRTATEANQDEASQNSVLANVAKNAELGIEFALKWCGIFIGVVVPTEGSNALKYELNTQFDLTAMQPQDLAQLVVTWQNKAITTMEFRTSLRRAGWASLDHKAFQAQLKTEETDGTAPIPPPKPIDPNNTQPGGNKPVAGSGAAA